MEHNVYGITGAGASAIAASIEGVIRAEGLAPGAALPPIRVLARSLRVSPGTVASSYSALQSRGILRAEGRRGTRVSPRPSLTVRASESVPDGVHNAAAGNPDPALLPDLRKYLDQLEAGPRLYGELHNRRELLRLAARQFAADGVPAQSIAVMGGALDAIERTLQAHLLLGDRVAVEDPGYCEIFDLISALGLNAVPVRVDECGMAPDDLKRALKAGASACIITPRAQNPTGAAHDRARARELRRLLDEFDETLVIEDDHAGPIAGAPYYTVCHQRKRRWAVVRSVSKSLGPDLRISLVAGDATTISRVEGRQAVGAGWVSHILQELVETILSDPATAKLLQHAAETYAKRRRALIQAFARSGISAVGQTGLNVWVAVSDEVTAVMNLRSAGWAVRAGERYRIKTAAAVRISVGRLGLDDCAKLAAAFARSTRGAGSTRSA